MKKVKGGTAIKKDVCCLSEVRILIYLEGEVVREYLVLSLHMII